MHVDHEREVLVQHRDRPLRPELLGERGEAADVGEQHGRLERLAAEHSCARGEQPVGDARVHVARHRRLHALLAADVLDHDHRAECRFCSTLGQRQTVTFTEIAVAVERSSSASIESTSRRLRGLLAPASSCSSIQAFGAGEELLAPAGRRSAPRRRRRMRSAAGVAGDDRAVLVERDDAVRHDSEHRLAVVLHVLDVVEELGVLERDRRSAR